MENRNLPTEPARVSFVDKDEIRREGIYEPGLNAFVENIDEDGPDEEGNVFPEEDIVEWEYLEKRDKPDSDIMIIL